MKKILVLGGNGFIGRNLCKQLLSEGEYVISFDMTNPKDAVEGIHYISGDFFDDYTLKNLLEDVDVVYHAISTLNPGNSNEKYIMGYERDFVQTVKLCSMLKEVDCKLIFLSSGGTVYGNQEIQPIPENAVPVPINHYGNLKLCIENTIRTFNFQNAKRMLVARISNPYGPGQDYHKGVGFIDAAVKKTLNHEPIEIWGDGHVVRDYIYIDDVCKMLAALRNYEGKYEVFNLSSGVGTDQNEIIEELQKIDSAIEVIYKPARNVDANKIILNNSRIMETVNLQLVDIKDGIRSYYEYVKAQIEEGV